MGLLEDFFSLMIAVLVVASLLTWAWEFYHRIKCRKVQSCAQRKCKYWNLCKHNSVERKKDDMELLNQMRRQWGFAEDDLNKETK